MATTTQRELCGSRAPSPSTSSPDDEECSFSPFSKREYLLAQMRQKDELFDSLLKQVRLSYTQLTNICAYIDYTRILQLHNPYLATPLSIQAYRNATSSSDQHRQTSSHGSTDFSRPCARPCAHLLPQTRFSSTLAQAKPVVSLMSRTKTRHLRGMHSHAVRRNHNCNHNNLNMTTTPRTQRRLPRQRCDRNNNAITTMATTTTRPQPRRPRVM
jgi:hypothetical protein